MYEYVFRNQVVRKAANKFCFFKRITMPRSQKIGKRKPIVIIINSITKFKPLQISQFLGIADIINSIVIIFLN